MKRVLSGCLFILLCIWCMVCPVSAGTPEIVIDGVVVQESKTHPILEACKKMQAQLRADQANGLIWEYHNGKKDCEEQWGNALAKGKRGCNCALLARWAIRESGLVGQTEGGFWGEKGGTIHWSGNAQAEISRTCDIIPIGGSKTVGNLMDSGWLQPGDIVTYVTMTHTNIYAGGNYWYDAGHAYCNGGGEGAVFRSWYGETVYRNEPVGYVIRYRQADIVIEDTTPDILIQDLDPVLYCVQMEFGRLEDLLRVRVYLQDFSELVSVTQKNDAYVVKVGNYEQKQHADWIRQKLLEYDIFACVVQI